MRAVVMRLCVIDSMCVCVCVRVRAYVYVYVYWLHIDPGLALARGT